MGGLTDLERVAAASERDISGLPVNNTNARLASSLIVKTGPGKLYGFTVSNTNVAAQFVQVFDSRTVPADGAVPLISKSVPLGDAIGFEWLTGRTFLYGIVLCNSTTQGSKTIGVADCIFDAQYV